MASPCACQLFACGTDILPRLRGRWIATSVSEARDGRGMMEHSPFRLLLVSLASAPPPQAGEDKSRARSLRPVEGAVVAEAGHPGAGVVHRGEIDIGGNDARLGTGFRQHLAPWRHNQRMPMCLPPV